MNNGYVLRFLVDTGSSLSLISSKIVNPIHFRKIPPVRAQTISGPKEFTTCISIPCLQALGQNTEPMQFYVDFEHDFFDGLLGNDNLLNFDFNIDYGRRELRMNGVIMKFYMSREEETEVENYRIQLSEEDDGVFDSVCEPDLSRNSFRLDHLNQEEFKGIEALLHAFDDLVYDKGERLTFTYSLRHRINTLTSQPIYVRSYRYPQVHKKVVDEQISEMLENGIIRPSESPYSSPIWVVPKKLDASGEQKWRLVIDYRKLNQVTVDDKFPIPNMDDILDKLGRSMYFTTLDLASGFHQIEIEEDDIPKTAFSTDSGHWEFCRMPFGLKNAPATFQRLMNAILADYIGKICFVYLDDVIIFSSSLDEHLVSVQKIFNRFRKHNLKIQPDKCEFLKHETEFLGHVVTTEGVKPNPSKISAIERFPIPTNVKEIRQFLGLVGFYRKFIPDFAHVAKPLTMPLRKNAILDASNEHYVSSFMKLKKLISTEPVLVYPDFDKLFVLTTDASNIAIGAVLSQDDHPVCYASRTLNEHETRYSAIEKELLAVVWATQYFRPYLFGRRFKVRTDHKPLQWLSSIKEPNMKLQRWKIRLEEFNFDVEYIAGKENRVADALSRVECNVVDQQTFGIRKVSRPINFYRNQVVFVEGVNNEVRHISMHGNNRVVIEKPEFNAETCAIVYGYLRPDELTAVKIDNDANFFLFEQYYLEQRVELKVVRCLTLLTDVQTEAEMRAIIFEKHVRGNHRGVNVVQLEIANDFYFPNMKKLTNSLINECEVCNVAKYERNPVKLPFKKTEIPDGPRVIYQVDVWFHSRGRFYLSCVDRFSKFAVLVRLKSRNWKSLREGFGEIFNSIGKPRTVIMDREPATLTEGFNDFVRHVGVEFHYTTPYNKSSNADIERFHNTLNEHVRVINAKPEHEKLFADVVREAVYHYNHTYHSTIEQKPSYVQFECPVVEIESIRQRLISKQEKNLEKWNKDRDPVEVDKNFMRYERLGKLNPKFQRVDASVVDDDYLQTRRGARYYKAIFKKKKRIFRETQQSAEPPVPPDPPDRNGVLDPKPGPSRDHNNQ